MIPIEVQKKLIKFEQQPRTVQLRVLQFQGPNHGPTHDPQVRQVVQTIHQLLDRSQTYQNYIKK